MWTPPLLESLLLLLLISFFIILTMEPGHLSEHPSGNGTCLQSIFSEPSLSFERLSGNSGLLFQNPQVTRPLGIKRQAVTKPKDFHFQNCVENGSFQDFTFLRLKWIGYLHELLIRIELGTWPSLSTAQGADPLLKSSDSRRPCSHLSGLPAARLCGCLNDALGRACCEELPSDQKSWTFQILHWIQSYANRS